MQVECLSLQFVVLLPGTSKKSTGLFSVWCTVSMEVQFSHPPSPSLLQAEQCQLLIDHIPQFHHHPLSPSAGLDFIGSSCTGGAKLSTTLHVLVSQGRGQKGNNHFPQPALTHASRLSLFTAAPRPFLQSCFLSSLSVHNLATEMLWEILASSL